MDALELAVQNLQNAIQEATSRFSETNVGDVQDAVAAERAKYEELVASEAAEDIAQNQELAEAKSRTDELLGQLAALPGQLSAMADQVNQLGHVASSTQTSDASQPEESATEPAPTDQPVNAQVETAGPTDTATDTLSDLSPEATTPADVGTTAAPADVDSAGTSEATPVDTGAAENQVSSDPAVGPSAVDNAADNSDTSSDPTDVSNLRPNL